MAGTTRIDHLQNLRTRRPSATLRSALDPCLCCLAGSPTTCRRCLPSPPWSSTWCLDLCKHLAEFPKTLILFVRGETFKSTNNHHNHNSRSDGRCGSGMISYGSIRESMRRFQPSQVSGEADGYHWSLLIGDQENLQDSISGREIREKKLNTDRWRGDAEDVEARKERADWSQGLVLFLRDKSEASETEGAGRDGNRAEAEGLRTLEKASMQKLSPTSTLLTHLQLRRWSWSSRRLDCGWVFVRSDIASGDQY